ncbi:hypothetical protein HOE425_331948 [Hoeflea sp. EC-HK425]|nr:hypothetical protein HOE425_331948 [Hoeflea sp. EC-HK425]
MAKLTPPIEPQTIALSMKWMPTKTRATKRLPPEGLDHLEVTLNPQMRTRSALFYGCNACRTTLSATCSA